MDEQIVDIGLYAAYALVVFCTLLAIVLPLINSIGNPKGLAKPGIGTLALGLIVIISKAFARGVAVGDTSADISQWVGGMLIVMYVLIGLAIAGIIFSEVSKVFR